jgi:hypothetical protein
VNLESAPKNICDIQVVTMSSNLGTSLWNTDVDMFSKLRYSVNSAAVESLSVDRLRLRTQRQLGMG